MCAEGGCEVLSGGGVGWLQVVGDGVECMVAWGRQCCLDCRQQRQAPAYTMPSSDLLIVLIGLTLFGISIAVLVLNKRTYTLLHAWRH